VLIAAAALAGSAWAGGQSSRDLSRNWAGYVVTGPKTSYTSVTGTWRQPRVKCGSRDAGASAGFWVGLGGYYRSSRALEQIGTASQCSATTGKPTYYAWFELVPRGSVTIARLEISPHDLITVSVNIVGKKPSVMLQVKNRTTKKTFTTRIAFPGADVSSAEWIAEAPAGCGGARCPQLALADFGSIRFKRIAALGNSIGGTLTSNPGWDVTSMRLAPAKASGSSSARAHFAQAAPAAAGAKPGRPTANGRAFTVTWAQVPATS
jgi:hypothetical protein